MKRSLFSLVLAASAFGVSCSGSGTEPDSGFDAGPGSDASASDTGATDEGAADAGQELAVTLDDSAPLVDLFGLRPDSCFLFRTGGGELATVTAAGGRTWNLTRTDGILEGEVEFVMSTDSVLWRGMALGRQGMTFIEADIVDHAPSGPSLLELDGRKVLTGMETYASAKLTFLGVETRRPNNITRSGGSTQRDYTTQVEVVLLEFDGMSVPGLRITVSEAMAGVAFALDAIPGVGPLYFRDFEGTEHTLCDLSVCEQPGSCVGRSSCLELNCD